MSSIDVREREFERFFTDYIFDCYYVDYITAKGAVAKWMITHLFYNSLF